MVAGPSHIMGYFPLAKKKKDEATMRWLFNNKKSKARAFALAKPNGY
jgi:hypothetical protein